MEIGTLTQFTRHRRGFWILDVAACVSHFDLAQGAISLLVSATSQHALYITPCMGLDLGFRIFLNLGIFEPPHGLGHTHLLDGCGISDLCRNDKLLFAPYKASQALSKSKIPNPRALMLA